MSVCVCLSVTMEQLGSYNTDFNEISDLSIFGKICQKTLNLITTRIKGKFYCFTVHFNSLNVTHQLIHFQYNNILV